jgi:hypothetical protein
MPFQNTRNLPGGGGRLGLNGYLKGTSPSTMSFYYYWGFPISESQVLEYTQMPTSAEFQQLEMSVNVTPDSPAARSTWGCRIVSAIQPPGSR